jgi:hypothetical protein
MCAATGQTCDVGFMRMTATKQIQFTMAAKIARARKLNTKAVIAQSVSSIIYVNETGLPFLRAFQ